MLIRPPGRDEATIGGFDAMALKTKQELAQEFGHSWKS